MFYILALCILVLCFFIFGGAGKIALSSYRKGALSSYTAFRLCWVTTALWYLSVVIIISLIGFHINQILGWVCLFVLGLMVLVAGFGTLGRDTRHAIDMATQDKELADK